MANLIFQSAEEAKKNITDEAKKEISDLYEKWSKELEETAEKLKASENASSSIQYLNVQQLRAQLEETRIKINEELEEVIKDSIYLVSDAVIKANSDWLKNFGFNESLLRGAFINVPDQIVRRLVTGQIYESGWSLSKSIWSDSEKTQKELYTIVAEGLAKNSSAYDIAKALESYVNPSRAKRWNPVLKMKNTKTGKFEYKRIYKKSVDYNAQRLARTLTQHAYQQTLVETTKNNPFITGFIWRANGSRVCDICAERDGKKFKKDELPLDHPNGMCVMEVDVDTNDMVDRLAAWVNSPMGTYPEIDAFANEFGYTG